MDKNKWIITLLIIQILSFLIIPFFLPFWIISLVITLFISLFVTSCVEKSFCEIFSVSSPKNESFLFSFSKFRLFCFPQLGQNLASFFIGSPHEESITVTAQGNRRSYNIFEILPFKECRNGFRYGVLAAFHMMI